MAYSSCVTSVLYELERMNGVPPPNVGTAFETYMVPQFACKYSGIK